MKMVLPIVLLLVNFAHAKGKPKDSDYQPGTLVSFRTATTGSSCSGSTDGKVEDSGNVSATTTSNCQNTTVRIYTIHVGEQTLSVEPAMTGKKKAVGMATLGWSVVLDKGSVLRDQLPGAVIKVRSDPSGLYVRVGKKESKFKVVGAE